MSSDADGNLLPPQFQSLKQLVEIDLGSNGMLGTISSFFCSFQNLGQLVFENNSLTGTIPNCLSNISVNFWKFEADNCLLSGTIPSSLGDIRSMLYIHLNDNLLEGVLPSQIASLPNLQWLTVENNKLSGSLPTALCRSSSAPAFNVDVTGNNFTCMPSCMASNVDAVYSSSTPFCNYDDDDDDSSSSSSSSSDTGELSSGVIAGISVACAVLLAGVIAAIYYKSIKQKQDKPVIKESLLSNI